MSRVSFHIKAIRTKQQARPITTQEQSETRRNALAPYPRAIMPDTVDLVLPRHCHDHMTLPASINGLSFANGRP